MTDKASSSASPREHLPKRGFWGDSRGIYVRGAVIMALLVALVPAMLMWSEASRGGFGGGLLMALLVLWAGAVLLLVPTASWVAWSVAAPGTAALLRWLRLSVVAAIASVVPLAVLLVVLKVPELWLWLAPPIAAMHALWTALFLHGIRR